MKTMSSSTTMRISSLHKSRAGAIPGSRRRHEQQGLEQPVYRSWISTAARRVENILERDVEKLFGSRPATNCLKMRNSKSDLRRNDTISFICEGGAVGLS